MTLKTKAFTANDYYSAAKERHKDLKQLEQNEDCIIITLYCSGLIVECILRAYIHTYTNEFDSKHNLEKLFVKSQLGNRLTQKEKESLSAGIKTASKIWSNSLRYTSLKRYRRLLAHEITKMPRKPVNLNKYLKKELTPLIESAKYIFRIGEREWKN